MFRPSDDATIYPFLIPSNCFAVISLNQLAELVKQVAGENELVKQAKTLAAELKEAIAAYATINHAKYGTIYAYETNGFGSYNLMDDANVPSLLSLPYLNYAATNDPVYKNTRQFLLSENNPFFFKGKAGEGIGGPHVGVDMIWPLSIIMRGITSNDDKEIKWCLDTLQKSHAGTGFMHESFHKDDVSKFTRKWFAWANTIFGEFVWKVYGERKGLLS